MVGSNSRILDGVLLLNISNTANKVFPSLCLLESKPNEETIENLLVLLNNHFPMREP